MVYENLNFRAVVILGATASGKTALAHELFDFFQLQDKKCELVNLDAFQIYKGLDIGTAKPSRAEIQRYKYHGIDICEPHENLDANTFARIAHDACRQIYAQEKIPICVGGSGLYLRAFLHGLDSLPMRDESIRQQIKEVALQEGWPACHDWLKKVDPARALELHPNDKVRIERALEIFLVTGTPQSANRSKENNLNEQSFLFPCYVVNCKRDPDTLKKRIALRVKLLFNMGWQQEVNALKIEYKDTLSSLHCMQAIGYKYILENPTLSHEEMIDKISTLTWHYAKKQMTWNAKEKVNFTALMTSPTEFTALSSCLAEFFQ